MADIPTLNVDNESGTGAPVNPVVTPQVNSGGGAKIPTLNISDESGTGQPTTDSPTNFNKVNGFKSFLDDVVSPFEREAASVKQFELTAKNVFGGQLSDKEQAELASGQYDDVSMSGKPVQAFSTKNPLDAMGGGLQMGSFFIPGAEGEKGAQTALETATKSGVLPKIWSFLKSTAPFAISQSLGAGAQDLGQGKSTGEALTDTALNYLTSVGGLGILNGMGGMLKMTAGALMKSDVVKAVNQSLLDFMSHSLSLDGRFAQDGENILPKDAALQTKALQQSFDPLHTQAMDALASAAKRPTTWDDLYRGVTGKFSDFMNNMFVQKDAKYGKVFTDDLFPNAKPEVGSDYAKSTFDALTSEKQKAGLTQIPGAGQTSTMSTADFLAGGNSSVDAANSPLGKYINLVESKLGTPDAPKALSMADFDDLFTKAPPGRDPIENKAITNIQTSLYDSAKAALKSSTDPRAPSVLQAWDEARTQWLNIKNMAGSKFSQGLKNLGSAKAFVDTMFKSSPTEATRTIINGLTSDPQTASQLSDMVYNMALDSSRDNANYQAGGAQLEKMLDAWSPTGILSPQHEAILRSFSSAMQGTYDDTASILQRLAGLPGEGEAPVSEAEQKMNSAEEAQGKLQQAQAIQKAMGTSPLYTVNKDGSFDFSNFSKVLSKINTDGKLDSLVSALGEQKSLTALRGSKLTGVLQTIIGTSLLFNGHPMIGAGAVERGVSKLLVNGEEMSTKDLATKVASLISDQSLSPGKGEKILTDLLTGKYDAVGDTLQKGTGSAKTKEQSDLTSEIEGE